MKRRRGALNAAGSEFKTVFGAATVMHLDQLHYTVYKLHDTMRTAEHLTYFGFLCEV